MAQRLDVTKTYKLFINGAFPRSESGRSLPVRSADGAVVAHICHGSRKDLRDAVEAAAAAQPAWAGRPAYNRGQILYRLAEMVQGKADELAAALRITPRIAQRPAGRRPTASATAPAMTARDAKRQVQTAVDRLVCFAGWADKFTQVMGGQNPVAGPYYNFTVPEPTGVVAIIPPDEPALLGLVTLLAPPLVAGNAIVAIINNAHPLAGLIFSEACATSDVPAGVINILSTKRSELLEHIAGHRAINAIGAANLAPSEAALLRAGAAENLKRVHVRTLDGNAWSDAAVCEGPWTIEPFVEMKTIWHPSAT